MITHACAVVVIKTFKMQFVKMDRKTNSLNKIINENMMYRDNDRDRSLGWDVRENV